MDEDNQTIPPVKTTPVFLKLVAKLAGVDKIVVALLHTQSRKYKWDPHQTHTYIHSTNCLSTGGGDADSLLGQNKKTTCFTFHTETHSARTRHHTQTFVQEAFH